jgi:hypothetical protein
VFTLLFLIERIWIGDLPRNSVIHADQMAEAG